MGSPGGQASGMVLISADKSAFESYGLPASLIAPTCEECGHRFGTALNALLRNRDTHLNIETLSYVFWTKEDAPFSVLSILSEAKPEDIRLFLQAAKFGRAEAATQDILPFYAAVLTARATRIVLRDWIETTLGTVQRNLAHYFTLQRLIDEYGQERWFSLWQLVHTTVRQKSKIAQPKGKEEISSQIGEALLHFALQGGTLPLFILHHTVQRIRAEQQVSPAQAACIKMVLLTQSDTSWLGSSNSQLRGICSSQRWLRVETNHERTQNNGRTRSTLS